MEININISNYEEYLLSAVDGELSRDEMVALEAFLQQHPHIREELALLESVRLMPDAEVSFDDKTSLYRTVNYESQLLDYIDNELHGADKQALELKIQQDTHLQHELNILQQARLQPDLSLQFGDKTVLYRNNRTKVRPIWWWSAAAAVVVGLAVGLYAPSPSEKPSQIADNLSPLKKQVQQKSPQQEQIVAQQTTRTPVVADETAAEKPQPATAQKTIDDRQTGNAGKQSLAANSNTAVAEVNTTDKQQAAADNNSIGLTRLAQPEPTSGEIVEQLQNKINEQQVAALEKAPVMANAATINKVSEAVAKAAPVQGELVVSVTMSGDSKLLNGVANVARFFSKKKK